MSYSSSVRNSEKEPSSDKIAISYYYLPDNNCLYPIDTINFERMSEVELAQYNSGRPDGQKIVCTEDDRSFSRVRRRRCVTFEQMYGSAAQVDQLSILN